ncbi:hypothetical protein MLD38_008376 [Melastoma candidum]|uniref:Uncharacterized protein n=1 Tax=Melastoma candidum TaxID=119954 RepID=A0ACB9RVZ7_9MYRT|nr:hypothetical protein MLD38_008376 [Melastoma candidum]
MATQEQANGRLVLVPGPFQGHLTPMLQLGATLHSRGFPVTVFHTQFNSPDHSAHPDFDFICSNDDVSENDRRSGNLIRLLNKLNSSCEASFQEGLRGYLEKEGQGQGIKGIVFDPIMYFTEAVARRLNIPRFCLITNSATTSLARAILPQLKAEGLIPLPDSIKQDKVPKLHPLRFKDLPVSTVGDISDLLQLIQLAGNMRTSSAIILNSINFLEESSLAQLRETYGVPIFPIGPLHKMGPETTTSLMEEDERCMAWLDKQEDNSVIYISVGSVASMNSKQMEEMAWGLTNSEQPFLWVNRPSASIPGSEWIESSNEEFKNSVKDRGCIVKWAPQRKVLAHRAVGGFWSHCGWNSTLESICEGVPMICQPCFGDQLVNARYVTHEWRVGMEAEGEIERGMVEEAVRRLMAGKEGEEMREKVRELKQGIDASTCEGGSSLESLKELVEFLLLPLLPLASA